MVLDYRGVSVDDDAIASAYVPVLRGTVPDLLVEVAEKAGMKGRVCRGNLADLRDWLAGDIPPILLLGTGRSSGIGHFVVVTGVSADHKWVCYHTDERPYRWRQAVRFLRAWKEGGNISVLIEPPRAADSFLQ